MQPALRASVAASFVAGLGVLVAFFVWHWFTIAPVWTVLVEGVVGVALAALAAGWAWRRSRDAGRFPPPWGGAAFGGVFVAGLLLAEAIGLARGPTPDPASVREALPILPFALAPVALVAAAGWRLARGWQGALAYALAGLVLLLYLGGSVVQRGGAGLGLQLFALLAACYLLAGVAIAAIDARLASRAT